MTHGAVHRKQTNCTTRRALTSQFHKKRQRNRFEIRIEKPANLGEINFTSGRCRKEKDAVVTWLRDGNRKIIRDYLRITRNRADGRTLRVERRNDVYVTKALISWPVPGQPRFAFAHTHTHTYVRTHVLIKLALNCTHVTRMVAITSQVRERSRRNCSTARKRQRADW